MTTTTKRICIYCGNPFEAPKPTTTMCQGCWYSGTHHEAGHKRLLYRLRSIKGIESATVDHTGGGCFGLAVRFTGGAPFLFATLAYKEPEGEWSCDVGIPEPGEPWGLGIYTSEEGDEDGAWGQEASEPIRCPLSDNELVKTVRAFARAKESK